MDWKTIILIIIIIALVFSCLNGSFQNPQPMMQGGYDDYYYDQYGQYGGGRAVRRVPLRRRF